MPDETYDGATTALRRWSKLWKALAKSYRQRHVWNGEVIERQDGSVRLLGIQIDGHLQRIEESDRRIDELAVIRARLERRIEELTAELEQARCEHPTQHHGRCTVCGREPLDTVSLAQYETDLASARAARESAEKLKELAYARTEEAARERDTALARAEAAETWAEVLNLDACDLRAKLGSALDDIARYAHGKLATRCVAAETALASARKILQRLLRGEHGLGRDAEAWLTSHPAPVAPTTDATCVEWAKHWGEVAEGKRHPWHENACAPVAAPCAGCAALQVDLAFAKSQRDDNENAWQCEKAKRLAREVEIVELKHHVSMLEGEFETCHRQHEQCMNLLARCSLQLPPGEMRDLVREMLSKGELPEGAIDG